MLRLLIALALVVSPAIANAGRLVAEATYCSGKTVQLDDVPSAGVICYAGDGPTLTLTLDPAVHLANNIYDVFKVGGVLVTGPAWVGNTPPARTMGTYLGTFLATANGKTSWVILPKQVAGGTNNILGVYNATNRVRVLAHEWDSFDQYGDLLGTGHVYELFHRSAKNKITWVDGEGIVQRSIRSNVTASQVSNSLSGGSTLNCVDYTNANVCKGVVGTTFLSNQQGTAIWADMGVDSGQTYYAETITYGAGVHSVSLLVSFPSAAWLYGNVASGMILDGDF